MKTKGCSFYPTHALPQKITVLCVDAIWLINSWNKCVLDVYTKLYHLWLREPLSFMLLTAMGVYDGEVSPIAFPYSITFLGHFLEMKYGGTQMFHPAKYSYYYIPVVLVEEHLEMLWSWKETFQESGGKKWKKVKFLLWWLMCIDLQMGRLIGNAALCLFIHLTFWSCV